MADPTPDVLVVREHLQRHLGPPADVLTLSGGSSASLPELEVAFFAPSGGDSPVLFATCGASQVMMKDGRRVEGVFMMRPRPTLEQAEVIVRLLGSFALYAEKQGASLGLGDVIPARDDLAPICHMDAVLLVPPVSFVPSFRRIEWRDRVADVMWILPVFQEEAAYALEHGPEALLTVFEAQGLDLSRLDRDQANTMIRPEDAKMLADSMERDRAAAPKAAVPPAPPRRGLAPAGVGADIVEEADGFVVQVKPPKPKKARPAKVPPAVVEEPLAVAPPRPSAKPGRTKAKKFDMNKGRAAVFAPRDDDREQLREAPAAPPPPPPPVESEADAKKKRVEALKEAAKARAAKAKEE